jgi:hypothetical protein
MEGGEGHFEQRGKSCGSVLRWLPETLVCAVCRTDCGLLLTEVHVMGPDQTDELNADATVQVVQQINRIIKQQDVII